MSNKKFILNADDFGMSKAFNKAVVDGYNRGFLTSASICANGEAFSAAVNDIIPECINLGVGVHLNIIEGRSLQDFTKTSMLTDLDRNFNNGFLKMAALSNNSLFLEQVEAEFRMQIEECLKHFSPDHLDSHVHVHSIPNIFNIVCKLAKEYNINYVRTQSEKFYLVPDIKKHLNLKYPPNIIKVLLLEYYTRQNKQTLKEYGLSTNDRILGVGYTGLMDDKTIEAGLSNLKEDCLVEALIHPCNFEQHKNQHYKEFLITQNLDLKDKIQRMAFEITNYKALNAENYEKI